MDLHWLRQSTGEAQSPFAIKSLPCLVSDACGGGGQNDFDTLLAPAIKTTAKGMGCAGAAAAAAPAMFVALAAAVGHILG